MKMKIRMILYAAVLLALSGNLFATGTQEQAAEQKVTLRVAWWGSQSRHDRTLQAINMYQETFPNITIEPEFSGWSGYWEKKAAEAAADNLPDVVQQDYQYLAQYVEKGLMLGLNRFVQDNQIDLRDAAHNSYAGGYVDDELYGVNLGTNAPCLIYDPAMFEQAGVDAPKADWTWSDYIETATTLHRNLGIYGDGDVPLGYNFILKYVARQRGQSFYSNDGKSLAYDNEVFTDAFDMEYELIQAGVIPPPDVRIELKGAENQLIVSGKSAMLSSFQSNQMIAIQKAANRPLNITLLPRDPNQKQPGLWLKPAMFFSVASTSGNQESAADFINYFINDIEANKVLMAERGIPISSKVRQALRPLLDETNVKVFDYIDLATANSIPIDPPDPPGNPEILKTLQNTEVEIMFGKITAAEGAKRFREEAVRILARQ